MQKIRKITTISCIKIHTPYILGCSDAFGSGSSPDGHTNKKSPLWAFFVGHFRRVRTLPPKMFAERKKHYRVSVRPIACDGTSALRVVAPTDTPKKTSPLRACFAIPKTEFPSAFCYKKTVPIPHGNG